MQITADVKCYYCGHISGQIIGEKEHPETNTFHPRAGYSGEQPVPGKRLHCERCGGPVYLEDTSPIEIPFMRPRGRRQGTRPRLSGAA
jgi:hypothetical protein